MGVGTFVRGRLHRRLFAWFALTTALSIAVVGAIVFAFLRYDDRGSNDAVRFRRLASDRFGGIWHDAPARGELSQSIARTLDVDLTLRDADGRVLLVEGAAPCTKKAWSAKVEKDGVVLGRVELCREGHVPRARGAMVASLVAVLGLMWLASGVIARRIARPITEIASVAEALGTGRHSTRVRTRLCHEGHVHVDEVGALATSINLMADRIEKQFRDQRELLAAVSHEIRTPLARLRVLVELVRARTGDNPSLDDIEREVTDMDGLVGELLASSRVDFGTLANDTLDVSDLASRALSRTGTPSTRLVTEGNPPTPIRGDATLLLRAVTNLIDNAHRHGGGLLALRITYGEASVVIAAEDGGPGLADDERARVFEPFFRGRSSEGQASGLGLGLALVDRIAKAHGGRAFAERLTSGERVGIELPLPSSAGLSQ